jgi:hypothetical protein
MTPPDADHAAIARGIVDANVYMTLGTADADGRPWVSPVFFAHSGYSQYYWISSPEARHSRNLAMRPELSIVVFDSQIPVGAGQAVYMEATAEQLAGDEIAAGLEIYPGGTERGARMIDPAELQPPGPYRLYRATVTQHWILDRDRSPDQRTAVTL